VHWRVSFPTHCNGHRKPKHRAAPHLCLHADVPPMRFDEALYRHKPKAAAGRLYVGPSRIKVEQPPSRPAPNANSATRHDWSRRHARGRRAYGACDKTSAVCPAERRFARDATRTNRFSSNGRSDGAVREAIRRSRRGDHRWLLWNDARLTKGPKKAPGTFKISDHAFLRLLLVSSRHKHRRDAGQDLTFVLSRRRIGHLAVLSGADSPNFNEFVIWDLAEKTKRMLTLPESRLIALFMGMTSTHVWIASRSKPDIPIDAIYRFQVSP